MANIQIIVLVSLLLIPLTFRCATADLDEETPIKKVFPEKNYVIEGMIYCQSCKDLGTTSLSGSTPIPYAKVSVTCTNRRDQVFYYKEYTANYYGYFYAKLEGFSIFDHPLTACKVKLVSSPLESCNIPTNVNNGSSGASLHGEHKRKMEKDCDYEFYAAGPLAFSSTQCNTENGHY